jgi:hypothetical protein
MMSKGKEKAKIELKRKVGYEIVEGAKVAKGENSKDVSTAGGGANKSVTDGSHTRTSGGDGAVTERERA